MSEFNDSFINSQRYDDAYNEAIQRSQGIAARSQAIKEKLSNEAMRKYEDEKQAQDEKYAQMTETLEALGLAPLHHSVESLIDRGKAALSKKVSQTATDLLDKGGEEVRNRLSQFIKEKGLNITPEELADKIKNRLTTSAESLQQTAQENLSKVTDNVKNAVSTGSKTLEDVAGKVDNATKGALDTAKASNVDGVVSKRVAGVRKVVGRNPRQSIKARGISDEERAQRFARSRRVRELRKQGIKVEPDEISKQNVPVTQEDLDRVRALSTPKQEPITLSADGEGQAFSQEDFKNMARNGWRMDEDSALRSTNPYSPYNNPEVKESLENFKEYGSLREMRASQRAAKNRARLEALKKGDTPAVDTIDKAPAKANDVAPQRLYGRGLDRGNVKPDAGDFKPSVGAFENQKADAIADLKESGLTIKPSDVKSSKLSSVADIQNNENALKETQAKQTDKNVARAVEEQQQDAQRLPANQPQGRGNINDSIGDKPSNPVQPRNGSDATSSSADQPLDQPAEKLKPQVLTSSSEKEGEDIGGDILKGLATAGEEDAELGGPGDLIGDGISLITGLGLTLGGIFGGHHKDPSPPQIHMPTPPAPLNPAASFGI